MNKASKFTLGLCFLLSPVFMFAQTGWSLDQYKDALIIMDEERIRNHNFEGIHGMTESDIVFSGLVGKVQGSGFVIEMNGKRYLLTSQHVISKIIGDEIEVVFPNGDSNRTRLVGADTFYDIALLEFYFTEPRGKSFVLSTTPVRTGDKAYAISNENESFLLKEGRIVRRGSYPEGIGVRNQFGYLAVSLMVKKGSSGGPLLDKDGQVIGIVSNADPKENLSFAVGSDILQRLIKDFLKNGRAMRAYVGAEFVKKRSGIMVNYLFPDGPLACSNFIQKGDFLKQINQQPIDGLNDILAELERIAPGDPVKMYFLREGKFLDTTIIAGFLSEAKLENIGRHYLDTYSAFSYEAFSSSKGIKIENGEGAYKVVAAGFARNGAGSSGFFRARNLKDLGVIIRLYRTKIMSLNVYVLSSGSQKPLSKQLNQKASPFAVYY